MTKKFPRSTNDDLMEDYRMAIGNLGQGGGNLCLVERRVQYDELVASTDAEIADLEQDLEDIQTHTRI